jgi:hypothetical protein
VGFSSPQHSIFRGQYSRQEINHMPIDLLEKPADLETGPVEMQKTRPVADRPPGQKPAADKRQNSALRRWLNDVFAGHEEFLGWTQD